jgi:hypothetical protein
VADDQVCLEDRYALDVVVAVEVTTLTARGELLEISHLIATSGNSAVIEMPWECESHKVRALNWLAVQQN